MAQQKDSKKTERARRNRSISCGKKREHRTNPSSTEVTKKRIESRVGKKIDGVVAIEGVTLGVFKGWWADTTNAQTSPDDESDPFGLRLPRLVLTEDEAI